MADPETFSGGRDLLLGEYSRTLDERFRLSLPSELLEALGRESRDYVLAKERRGCLSLWRADQWARDVGGGIDVIRSKLRTGRLSDRGPQIQLLGRLLSSRHRRVQLSERGRLLIPEGSREFLRVEPGGEVTVIGAAVCIELWEPGAWLAYMEGRMPRFNRLFRRLSR